jgi:hypothetical protein
VALQRSTAARYVNICKINSNAPRMLYYIHRFREAGTGQETTQAAEYPVAFCWFLGIGHTWP